MLVTNEAYRIRWLFFFFSFLRRGTFILPIMMSFGWRFNGHFSCRNVCLLSWTQPANRNLHTRRRREDYTVRQTTCFANSWKNKIELLSRDRKRNHKQQFVDHLSNACAKRHANQSNTFETSERTTSNCPIWWFECWTIEIYSIWIFHSHCTHRINCRRRCRQ